MRAAHAAALIASAALIAGAGVTGLLDPAGLTDRDSPALPIAIAFVLIFLILLIVRYVLLLWLGFLHHMENRASANDRTPEPPVTIIVPVYNEATVILSALRSLLALRYPSLEIIVVDDGSTDRTLERATSLAGRYATPPFA
jgi:cellulose synthase/poly-beta-1,6-N-acetylglucosamine synthase-like glycosyltransferase